MKQSKNVMQFEKFGGIEIFRPSYTSELEVRFASEDYLRKKYSVGRFTDKETINNILQYQFGFYERLLEELISEIASHQFLDFVLYQFDSASEVENLYKDGKLDYQKAKRWREIGQVFRRAAKHIAEKIALLQPNESPKIEKSSLLHITEKIWICAEEMISLYTSSDQTYSIFPNETFLEIFPSGQQNVFFLGLTIDFPPIESRVYLDAKNRHRFISDLSFPLNVEEHDEIIGDIVKEKIGVTYKEALGILGEIIEKCIPPAQGFPVPFISKENLIAGLSKSLNFSEESIINVVNGFSLTKEQMAKEGKQVWNSKQEYRAYRRAFFEMPHHTGQHISFSKDMAKECLLFLIKDTVFTRFPKEWSDSSVEKVLGKLSNTAGKWFENNVESNISNLNFKGKKSAKNIGIGANRINLLSEIGEVDYIGYSEKEEMLLIAECKFIRDSYEPKLFRDDIYEFVNAPKSYVKKFRKKCDWIQNNIPTVCKSLESTGEFKTPVKPKKIAKVIITFFPTMASYFIEDFPCVSLTEFMLDYEALGKYPYEIGVHHL